MSQNKTKKNCSGVCEIGLTLDTSSFSALTHDRYPSMQLADNLPVQIGNLIENYFKVYKFILKKSFFKALICIKFSLISFNKLQQVIKKTLNRYLIQIQQISKKFYLNCHS